MYMKFLFKTAVIIFALTSCSESNSSLSKIDQEIMILNSKATLLLGEITSRKMFDIEITSSPFATIRGSDGSVKYSFFEKEKAVYQGEYLDAWHERMMSKSVRCYPLKKSDIKFLVDEFNDGNSLTKEELRKVKSVPPTNPKK